LNSEFERERESFLETIREQNREMMLWEQVVRLLLPAKTITKIVEKAVWDDDLDEWRLPQIQRGGGSTGSSSGKQQSAKLPTLTSPAGLSGQ